MATEGTPVVELVKKLAGFPIETCDEGVEWLNMLVYGKPGEGKTVLAGSATEVEDMSPVLFIDCEGGTVALKNTYPKAHRIRVTQTLDGKNLLVDWKMIEAIYQELRRGKHDYQTVVIDSLSELQRISMEIVMKQMLSGPSGAGRDPDIASQREWGKVQEQLRRVVRQFRDLPMHTIFITHVATRGDDGIERYPSLPGKLANEVAGFVDLVLFLYTKQVQNKETKKSEIKRAISCAASPTLVAKDRTGILPPIMEDPTMAKIYKAAFPERG